MTDTIEEPKRGSVKKICEYCGNVFYVQQYRKDTAKFCSRKCKNDSKSKIKKICEYCGCAFYVHRYCADSRKYCSKECKFKAHNINVVCLQCGKGFSVKKSGLSRVRGKFCSRECYSKYRSENYFGKNHPRYEEITTKCTYCGKEYHIQQNQIRSKEGNFCSKVCHNKWKSENLVGENAPRWEGGISFEPYCILFNKEFKNRVRAYFGNKCVVCGKSKEENHNRVMCVHHVNYDKDTCCNDSDRLFVPLCISCHTTTNHNREYWQEYFTKMIKEEYNGKCYYTKEEYNAIRTA